MVKVSAPAKVHLIGEHAVVYNEPAILAAVGLRTFVDSKKSENVFIMDTKGSRDFPVSEVKEYGEKTLALWKECSEKKDFTPLFDEMKGDGKWFNFKKAAIGVSLNELGIDQGVSIVVDSQIPVGSGLGSSASLAAAIPYAIARTFEKDVSLEKINEIALTIEKFNHGMPSGGDNSACCYGGLIQFQKNPDGGPPHITSLKQEIPDSLEGFVLVYTGPPNKTTGELVQQVANQPPEIRDSKMKEIGQMAEPLKQAVKEKNSAQIIEIMNKTQENLTAVGVSTETIDKIAKTVREIGGAAKLCGAGGGGIMLCYHSDVKALEEKIKELGFKPLVAQLSVEGITEESGYYGDH